MRGLAKGQFAEAAGAANAALAAMKTAPAGAGLAAVPFEGLQGAYFLQDRPALEGPPDAAGDAQEGASGRRAR